MVSLADSFSPAFEPLRPLTAAPLRQFSPLFSSSSPSSPLSLSPAVRSFALPFSPFSVPFSVPFLRELRPPRCFLTRLICFPSRSGRESSKSGFTDRCVSDQDQVTTNHAACSIAPAMSVALKSLVINPAAKHTATVIFLHVCSISLCTTDIFSSVGYQGLGDTGYGWEDPLSNFGRDPGLSHVKWVLPHA